MIVVSNKVVNVFTSEEMNDSHKKKQRKECGSSHSSNR